MSESMLSQNSILYCSAGQIRVLNLLGAGGQGEVYKVELNGKQYALKYYFPENCNPNFKKNLKIIIENPVEPKHFLWPLYFVENGNQFGYVMDLMPSGYCTVDDWISGRVDTTIEKLLVTCINLCDGFHDLHARGYSYKDISRGNVSFNPDTGDVLILDNDNVTPNLESSGIKGTPQFMAPELVSGYEKTPTRKTDLFSLAVLLFYLLTCEHPLEGNFHNKSETDFANEDDWAKLIYGYDTAQFIFADESNLERYIDTNVDSNINAKEMWLMYPERIKKLFRRAFVEGIKNPDKRPQAFEWTEAFIKTLATRYSCPDCNHPMFFDKEEFKRNRGKSYCEECGHEICLPIIRSHGFYIMVNDKDSLYSAYFGIIDETKMDVLLIAEYKKGNLRFLNKSRHSVICHGVEVGYGEYTEYISDADSIVIDGRNFEIAMPI